MTRRRKPSARLYVKIRQTADGVSLGWECPHCKTRHAIRRIGDDVAKCDHCRNILVIPKSVAS